MADKKVDLGTVKKQLPSNFWETSTGARIPNFTGMKAGLKVTLANGKYDIKGVTDKTAETPVKGGDDKAVKKALASLDAKEKALDEKMAALDAKMAELEAKDAGGE